MQRFSFGFHTWPSSRNANDPVIYFVFDDVVPILLYIGQAVKAHQCWAGVHDCKTYVDKLSTTAEDRSLHGILVGYSRSFQATAATGSESDCQVAIALQQREPEILGHPFHPAQMTVIKRG